MKIQYVAENGIAFNSKEECENYEKNCLVPLDKAKRAIETLQDFCRAYLDENNYCSKYCPYYSEHYDNCKINNPTIWDGIED